MATRSDFTASEWTLLGDAPLAAGAAVALAEPGGAEREAQAMLSGWHAAAALFPEAELIQAIATDLDPQLREQREQEGGQPRRPALVDNILDEAVALCAGAVRLLRRKASDQELEAYRKFVFHIVTEVANAASVGGVLGLGGVRVTRNERVALREIADALGLSPLD